MSTLSGITSKLRWLMAAIAVVVAIGVGFSVFLYLASEETAEARGRSLADARQARQEARKANETKSKQWRENWDRRQQEREAEWARLDAESAARVAEAEKLHNDPERAQKRAAEKAERRRKARAKLWLLRSPAAIREALWSIPRTGGDEATVEGMLRVCVSEAGWRPEGMLDCVWIWQVVQNIRSRSCNRAPYRGPMDCDENGETNLSAMRRLSGRVLDESKARTERQRWLGKLSTSCERPLGFPRGDSWERNLKAPCERITREVRAIVQLKASRRLTKGAIPIAWGGRCEDSRGACDDKLACKRGLARIETKTANAFWCKISSAGCRSDVDPICSKMGYGIDENGRYTRRAVWGSSGSTGSAEESSRAQDGEMPVSVRGGESAFGDEASGGEGDALRVSDGGARDVSDTRVQDLGLDKATVPQSK